MQYIVANWKSNKNISEALDWVEKVGPKIEKSDKVIAVVCVPYTDLEEVKKTIQVGGFELKVGVQDISPFEEGAYTGEEAARLLKGLAEYVIVGHSERRREFEESDELIAKKVIQAGSENIEPVLCVQGVETPIPSGVKVVAYEPVFAIGTGTPDTPQNANDVCSKIKQSHAGVEVLYGGSVTSENAKAFLVQEDISGLLIGKASLEAEEFVTIMQLAQSL